jgi:hypothetical protein
VLFRRIEGRPAVAVPQPAHAWISGQLARAWGNQRFGAVEPREAVCLAAEQHDIGWLPWEAAPTRDPATGLPWSFTALPRTVHAPLWAEGVDRAEASLGRYVALLVSLHGMGIYVRFGRSPPGSADAAAVEAFNAHETVRQRRLLASLAADPAWEAAALPEAVARNRALVLAWDLMSLILCHGLSGTREVAEVPDASGMTTLTLTAIGDDPERIAVDPWPFTGSRVAVACEGLVLPDGPFDDDAAMREALAAAPRVDVRATLTPR